MLSIGSMTEFIASCSLHGGETPLKRARYLTKVLKTFQKLFLGSLETRIFLALPKSILQKIDKEIKK